MFHNMARATAGRNGGGSGGLPEGTIAKYTGDNISGTTLFDEGGNYNGVMTNVTQTPGQVGQALYFNSVAYVSFADIPPFYTSAFTLTLYAQNDSTGAWRALWHQASFQIRTFGGSHWIYMAGLTINAVSITQGVPYRLDITWDGTGDTDSIKFYKDKVLVATRTPSSADTASTVARMGGLQNNSYYFVGWMDEVTIRNYAMTQSEIDAD
ncbi:LamG-like jellyroll fold domain-containing protein [Marinobacterium lutimaris]|uniref:Concanavalin A-like lectin/glucanases superfamily protein n=1 Tax=Marinobacterium lutimaris TaxID=568106 RepID=A0A1H5XSG7_9GAMM|nr:LamG-like jellyroll fold domain-containing protein [Marinobacterium lutimaris]SEG14330.1 Concanavalin A-like lectin/glucanases superfamily protein [Marinobacterium lutimaris]